MNSGVVLITGANGYLGGRLAERYLATTDSELLLLLHASSQAEFENKRDALTAQFERRLGGKRLNQKRVSFVAGDLSDDDAFAEVNPYCVESIVHSAAVTRFNVEPDLAQRVNIDGSSRVFRFAESCDRLSELAFVSSVYSSGLRSGTIGECSQDGSAGFANHYERSKWVSEEELISRYDHLPWRIFRVATVIADDNSGNVSQQNAVHNTLKLFFYGLLSVLPGMKETPLYFVTGDFVVDAIMSLLNSESTDSIYNVCHKRGESATLGELVDTAFDAFESDSNFARRKVLKPLYSDLECFNLLADATTGFQQGVLRQAVSSVTPFGPQLFISKEFDNSNLVEDMPAYSAPDPVALIARSCENLVRSKWGRLEAVAR